MDMTSHRALAVPCPTCMADIGQLCRSMRSGSEYGNGQYHHRARHDAREPDPHEDGLDRDDTIDELDRVVRSGAVTPWTRPEHCRVEKR